MNRIRIIVAAVVMAVGLTAFAGVANAAVTNCSKGTSGTYGWSYCANTNGNPPYTTRHVIVVDCVRPWWLGGGSYTKTGFWATTGNQSEVFCATYYNATNPRILFG